MVNAVIMKKHYDEFFAASKRKSKNTNDLRKGYNMVEE